MERRTLSLLVLAIALVAVVACGLFSLFVGGPTSGGAPETGAAEPDEGPARPADAPLVAAGAQPDGPGLAAPLAKATRDARAVVAAAPVPAGSRALAGRVVLPPGTPADERLLVLAANEPLRAGRLYGPGGVVETAWKRVADPASELGGQLVAVAEVEADGAFVLGLPAEPARVHVALSGRYLHSRATTPADTGADGVVLTGELGAWITGVVAVPGDASAQEADLSGVDVVLEPDVSEGFDVERMRSRAIERQVAPAPDGGYELRAVPSGGALLLAVRHARLAAHVEPGLRLEPGEHARVDAALARGGALRGRVVTDAGAPVAGAKVEARLRGLMGRVAGALRKGETDADGRFELVGVAPGELELSASRDGFREGRLKPERQLAPGGALEGLELVLARGERIVGRVVFADGAPAAGASVRATIDIAQLGGMAAMGGMAAREGSAESDAEGRFEVAGLAASAYDLRARLELEDGERAGDWSASARGAKPGGAPLELVLAELGALRGRVVDGAGAPLARFEVAATRKGSGGMFGIGEERRRESVEDELEGRFRIDGLAPATWTVVADAQGYARSQPRDVVVPAAPAAAGADELLLELVPAAEVAGTVLDTSGAPVAGAEVSLELDMASMLSALRDGGAPSAYSDVEGRFRLLDLEPGPLSLVAKAEGFAASEPVAREVAPGAASEDVVLTLRVGGAITGEVLDDEGGPALGKRVTLQLPPSYLRQHMLLTDAAGRFAAEHLEPGRWQVVATSDFMAMDQDEGSESAMADLLGGMEMEFVDVVEGETVHVVLGAKSEHPVRVHGRVRHAGEPVGSAAVSFVAEEATSGKPLAMSFTKVDGTFDIELEHAGAYLVTVQTSLQMGRQNSLEFLERIPAGVADHDIELAMPLGRISGRVLGPEREPAAGCRITLTVDGGVSYGSFLGGHYTEVAADDQGRFDIQYLRPGKYTVAAGGSALGGLFGDEPKWGRAVKSGVAVADGQWLEGLDFRLAPPSELVGTVRGDDGQPAPGASVYVRDEGGRLMERFSLLTTDGAGRFRYRGLSPGAYTVSAQKGELSARESALVSVREGAAAEAALTLEPATTLLVVVLDKTGEEVRARVSVKDEDGREMSGMLSMSTILESFGQGFSSKEQRVGPLVAGRYTVTATADDGREASKTVAVGGTEERKVKLRLR